MKGDIYQVGPNPNDFIVYMTFTKDELPKLITEIVKRVKQSES